MTDKQGERWRSLKFPVCPKQGESACILTLLSWNSPSKEPGQLSILSIVSCRYSPLPTPDLVRKGLPSTGSEPTMKDLLTWKILSFPLSPHLPDQAVDHLNMKYRNTIFYLHFRKREGDVQSLLHVCHLSLGFFTFCLKEKKKNQENERGSSPPSKFVIWWWVWYVMGTLFWCVYVFLLSSSSSWANKQVWKGITWEGSMCQAGLPVSLKNCGALASKFLRHLN